MNLKFTDVQTYLLENLTKRKTMVVLVVGFGAKLRYPRRGEHWTEDEDD